MHLVVIGLSHKTAPVEIREKVTIAEALLPNALEEPEVARPHLRVPNPLHMQPHGDIRVHADQGG